MEFVRRKFVKKAKMAKPLNFVTKKKPEVPGQLGRFGNGKLLYTYCCAQFMVRRDRFFAIDLKKIARLNHLVDGSIPDMCRRIGPSCRLLPEP